MKAPDDITEEPSKIKALSREALKDLIPVMQFVAVLQESSIKETREIAASILPMYVQFAKDYRRWSGSRECF